MESMNACEPHHAPLSGWLEMRRIWDRRTKDVMKRDETSSFGGFIPTVGKRATSPAMRISVAHNAHW